VSKSKTIIEVPEPGPEYKGQAIVGHGNIVNNMSAVLGHTSTVLDLPIACEDRGIAYVVVKLRHVNDQFPSVFSKDEEDAILGVKAVKQFNALVVAQIPDDVGESLVGPIEERIRVAEALAKGGQQTLESSVEPKAEEAGEAEEGPLRWHRGPTVADDSPHKMWCDDCHAEVLVNSGILGCSGCGKEEVWTEDAEGFAEPPAAGAVPDDKPKRARAPRRQVPAAVVTEEPETPPEERDPQNDAYWTAVVGGELPPDVQPNFVVTDPFAGVALDEF
jgi:hypothetical protein